MEGSDPADMNIQSAGDPGKVGVDLQNNLGAGLDAFLLPHLAQAHLKTAVFVHGADGGNEGIAGVMLVDKAGIVTDVADNVAGVAMLHAFDKCFAVKRGTGVDVAVHSGGGDKFIVAGAGFDAFHILYPGRYGMKLPHKGHRLVAAAGKTDPVTGCNQIQTALKGGALLIQ